MMLSLCIFGLITVVMIFSALFNYEQLKAQNNMLFRKEMKNSAHIIDVLIGRNVQSALLEKVDELLAYGEKSTQEIYPENKIIPYNRGTRKPVTNIFSFQIYNALTQQVVLRSQKAPFYTPPGKIQGFNTIKSKGKTWLVYNLQSHFKPYEITIFVPREFKTKTFMSVFKEALWDLFIFYLLAAVLSLVCVRFALASLSRVAQKLANRDADKLKPIHLRKVPIEIAPLIDELNTLFRKFNAALHREKRFAADAAHELKTPLAIIKTQAEVARNANSLEEIKPRIDHIITSINQYTHIIEQLLTLNKLESMEEIQDCQPVDLNQVTHESVSRHAAAAVDKDIELSLNLAEPPLVVYGTSTTLDMLLRNLIDNAIKYTPENGSIDIKTFTDNRGNACLTITDTGPGVAPGTLERLFDRFYRESGTNVRGSGLGLSITEKIVTLYGGTIQASRPDNGKGLCISVTIPLADTSAQPEAN